MKHIYYKSGTFPGVFLVLLGNSITAVFCFYIKILSRTNIFIIGLIPFYCYIFILYNINVYFSNQDMIIST